MRKFIISSLLATGSLFSMAQDAVVANQTQPIASYDIDAKLDDDAKMISGTQILTWKNMSNDTISELMFHTYLNAFKNTESTYSRELQREEGYGLGEFCSDSDWGYIDILRMVVVDGEPLTTKMSYVHPDTENSKDQTVVLVKLTKPVMPGQTIKLDMKFQSKLPRIVSRTGYERGDFYMVGQWFPKIAVYEPAGMRNRKKGGWNCHEFHLNSEFYADFGNYNVTLTLPDKYVVGATGVETYNSVGEGKKVVKYEALDVVDFAWTASPRYQVLPYSVNVGDKVIGIKLLSMPENSSKADRYFESIKNAIEYMHENVGELPYNQMTIVDCPFYAPEAAGMEYPMLITVNTKNGIFDFSRSQEAVTIHEFIHNYFMATVATNEFEEAWLDEGFTQFFETEVMDHYYGDGSLYNFFGFKQNDSEESRTNYTQSYNPAIGSIDNFVWRYPTHTYGMLVYSKTATMLRTIKGMLGADNFKKAIQLYYNKWKFGHPCSLDFYACVNQVVAEMNNPDLGKNLNWFFQSAFRTDEVCDYKLTKITNEIVSESAKGFFDSGLDKILGNEDSESVIKSSVFVQRMGTMVVPVEVLVTFKNGETELVKWDGKGRCKEFQFTKNSSVVSAQIDPENKIACDIDLINNSISYENNSQNPIWKYAAKFLFWLENIFQTISFFA